MEDAASQELRWLRPGKLRDVKRPAYDDIADRRVVKLRLSYSVAMPQA